MQPHFYQEVSIVRGSIDRINNKIRMPSSGLLHEVLVSGREQNNSGIFVNYSPNGDSSLKLEGLKYHGRELMWQQGGLEDEIGRVLPYVGIKGCGHPREAMMAGYGPLHEGKRMVLEVNLSYPFACGGKPDPVDEKGNEILEGVLADTDNGKIFLRNWNDEQYAACHSVGLYFLGEAQHQFDVCNWLRERGITRTFVPIAVVELKEVIEKDGTIVDVNNLNDLDRFDNDGNLSYRFTTALSFRGMKDPMRVEEAGIEDLIQFYEEDNTINDWKDLDEYHHWWIEMVASNLARMHNLEMTHGNFLPINIGRDSCIFDFGDSIAPGLNPPSTPYVDESLGHRSDKFKKRENKDKEDLLYSCCDFTTRIIGENCTPNDLQKAIDFAEKVYKKNRKS
ncbi:MAG: hypothetical protein ABIG93_03110 [archaeon]|nr:hypothetical protein [Nanoarchaeota archaeon]